MIKGGKQGQKVQQSPDLLDEGMVPVLPQHGPSLPDQLAVGKLEQPHLHKTTRRSRSDYVIYYLLKAYSYSPVNLTGSPQGFLPNHIVEYNAKHAYFTNATHKLKVRPFGIALRKKWQIKLGDARTIDRLVWCFNTRYT